jgi:hypothetical protein
MNTVEKPRNRDELARFRGFEATVAAGYGTFLSASTRFVPVANA